MNALPFTVEAFLQVFARYNDATWPVVIGLWMMSVAALAAVALVPGARSSGAATAVLVALWCWGGVAYHATYFTSINPAAWGFAALFVVEAGLLAWYGLVRDRLVFGTAAPTYRGGGFALALYALAYPALNLIAGHTYPASPTFGVPCPTGIFTIGLFLTTPTRPPVAVVIVPLLWSLIGGSAALLLGVTTDYVLLVCAVLLIVDLAQKVPVREEQF